ncbi:MAG: hypothetical protein LBG27_09380 [Spirochaetaceae bacterium]|nr:hypothetical protein [Spirochaetaceae bacterium]
MLGLFKWNYYTRIIVAGGGPTGGDGFYNSTPLGTSSAQGGTQQSGNQLGIGGNAGDSQQLEGQAVGRGGGGGGYYGGAAKDNTDSYAAGGGGSGFVYGYTLTPGSGSLPDIGEGKYRFTRDFACIAGSEGRPNPDPYGHGHIRITYMP